MKPLEQVDDAMGASEVTLARRFRKAIAVYLVVSALYAVAGFASGGTEMPAKMASMALMAAFLVATFAGGAGLFLGKTWGYWTALIVLALQLVKIQFNGFTYDVLSLVGIYVYAGGKFSIGISAAFDPSVNISIGTSASWWLGVNVFIALPFAYLLTARGRRTADSA